MSKYFYKNIIFFVLIVSILSFLGWFLMGEEQNISLSAKDIISLPITEAKIDKIIELKIIEGSTYGALMKEADIDYDVVTKIYAASESLYDLAQIRLGKSLELVYDQDTGEFKKLVYQINSEEKLYVNKGDDENWQAEIKSIEYEIKIKTARGEVKSSLYEAALESDIDERLIIDLANAFQWSIDFAMDPRAGDTFQLVYEERYLGGEYVMPGKILAGKYINDGERYDVYYFKESEDNIGYFDIEGNSVQKMFLKSPVEFRYISSGYTTGGRVIMEFGMTGPHRAIDYAAAVGTPIRSVGDGTVTFAGWSSIGYGYLTKIHHNATYSTNYAHQSKIAVKAGQKVKQGEVIGYVGSTGFSTGPHLHYEMVKNGAKINPLKEVLPPGKPIKEENKKRFFEEIEKYQKMIK